MTSLSTFMLGALTALSVVASGAFVRFWRSSRDRIFLFFAAAFVTMAANWTALAVFAEVHETQPYVFLVRLMAFGLILAGIIDKNRSLR